FHMPSIHLSVAAALSKSADVANFFSSLNTTLGGMPSLFDNLLSQAASSSVANRTKIAATPNGPTSKTPPALQSDNVQDVADAWRAFIEKWQQNPKSKMPPVDDHTSVDHTPPAHTPPDHSSADNPPANRVASAPDISDTQKPTSSTGNSQCTSRCDDQPQQQV